MQTARGKTPIEAPRTQSGGGGGGDFPGRLARARELVRRALARRASTLGDDGTNDLVVSEVLRTNELQVWFLSEHLVNVPLVEAQDSSVSARAS